MFKLDLGKNFFLFNSKNQLEKYLINEISTIENVRNKSSFIISGGTSLNSFFLKLAKIKLSFSIILSDERIVEKDSLLSNQRNVFNIINKETYKSNINIISEDKGAINMKNKLICELFEKKIKNLSKVDFGIISVGADGHFASIFSQNNKKLYKSKNFLISKNKSDYFKRLSFNFEYFINLKKIYFIINDISKSVILTKIITQSKKDTLLPIIKLLNARGENKENIFLVNKECYKNL